ncbi:MAG: glycosyltransferase [Ignavibacteriae bacterium]|nr:glycosyltransferase [Ignavibacteriota bacterium]MCB9207960.1 glycosyltransferase [Ignavibacteriales bacterium]MCB9258729.1 glycosyltransferase [Ignavibacteriales bacterium]
MSKKIDLSAIIVYYQNYEFDKIKPLFETYKKNLQRTNRSFEVVFVIDGNMPKVLSEVQTISSENDNIKIIKLGRWFGDATSLQAGFESAEGDLIITLPSFQQVEADEIPNMLQSLENYDMVVGWRHPRIDSFLNNLQSKVFNNIIKTFVGTKFHDLKCNVRLFKREILENIYMYGDQDRFLPLWAWRLGYKVNEIKVKQHKADFRQNLYPLQSYVQRTLELISLFFLIKFTKKPIRFFGSSGLIIFSIGLLLGFWLFIQRMFMGVGLADRPMVLVSILLIIFGILAFAIGLVGELIIFTHAKDIKDYIIEKVYSFDDKKKSS